MEQEELYNCYESGDLKTVKELHARGADIHENGEEPLDQACAYGRLNVVKYLVEDGADIHTNGNSSLIVACEYGEIDVVKYLVEQGAKIDKAVLFWTGNNGHKDVSDYIIKEHRKHKLKNLLKK